MKPTKLNQIKPNQTMKDLERLKKNCSHLAGKEGGGGLFGFWLRFGSVTGLFKPAPSPKPRQTPKILAPNGYSYSLTALATDDTEIVLSLWAAVAGESGVAAPALPPQSITRWVGRAVRGTRVSQAWAVPQSACSAGI